MANIASQALQPASSIVHTYTAVAASDFITNVRPGTILIFETTHTVDNVVTVESQVDAREGFVEQDDTITVAAATDRCAYVVTSQYIDSQNRVQISTTPTTGCTVCALRPPTSLT